MKNFNSFNFFLLTLWSLLCLFSCKIKNEPKSIKFPLWSPGIAAQLLDMNLTLKDVVAEQDNIPFIQEDSDGFYTFVYSDTVFSERLADKLVLPKQTVNESFTVPAISLPPFIATGSYVDSIVSNQSFTVSNGEKLNRIDVLSGNINVKLDSKFQHDVILVVKFPYITDAQNKLLSKTYNLVAGSAPVNDPINLAGYKIDLTRGGTVQNSLDYKLIFTLIKKSNNILANQNSLSVGLEVDNLKYSYIEGYLGKFKFDLPEDSVEIDLFQNAINGEIYFKDPKFTLLLANSAGIPMEVLVNKLVTKYADKSITPLSIKGPAIGSPVTINSPTLSQKGQTVLDSLVYDNASTGGTIGQSIQNVFKPSPFKVVYDAEFSTNPSTTSGINFITNESRIVAEAEVSLPMEGRIKKLTIVDTVNITADNDFQSEYSIKYIKYKLNTINGFPFVCDFQGYFIDSLGMVSDSISHEDRILLPAAIVDANGKVTQPSTAYAVGLFDKNRYKNVQFAKKLLLIGKFNTIDNGDKNVKIYSSYKVTIKLSAEVEAEIDLNDN